MPWCRQPGSKTPYILLMGYTEGGTGKCIGHSGGVTVGASAVLRLICYVPARSELKQCTKVTEHQVDDLGTPAEESWTLPFWGVLPPLPVRVPQETCSVHSAEAKGKPLSGGEHVSPEKCFWLPKVIQNWEFSKKFQLRIPIEFYMKTKHLKRMQEKEFYSKNRKIKRSSRNIKEKFNY